jgi:hypothetical protein
VFLAARRKFVEVSNVAQSLPARAGHHNLDLKKGETKMLWTIVAVLLILWLLGFSLHVAGGLIHLLLVVALIVIVVNLVSGRRAV